MHDDMNGGAVDMNATDGAGTMPEADESAVMEGGEGSPGVESRLMPGESADDAGETGMELAATTDPMGGALGSMSVAKGGHPIELAGLWKLTLSISS